MTYWLWPHSVGRPTKGGELAGVPNERIQPDWTEAQCLAVVTAYLRLLVDFVRDRQIARVAVGLKVEGELGLRRTGLRVVPPQNESLEDAAVAITREVMKEIRRDSHKGHGR